jgi:hypothetical protein
VLSKTARKGDVKEMSTEKDEAKEKAETTEEEATEEKPESAEKKEAKEKPESAEKKEAKKKPESAEKEKAKKKPKSAEKEKAKNKPESEEKEGAKEKPASADKADSKEKPLEKMTVKDLREMAKDMPGISGVHGMKKEELLVAIKNVKGIEEKPVKKAGSSVTGIKTQIKSLKAQRQTALEANDKKMATIYKRRISKLKKKTRRKAA